MLNEKELPFLAEKGHIVSLVGGGGKTTLLYAMAAHCARKGWRVLVTTTTHIRQPAACYAPDDAALTTLWQAGHYAVVGTLAENGKLTLPQPKLLRRMAQADAVFIEADGAKHCPCKVPAAHEPVLLPQSDIVLAVAGLSALGKPLREVCFRYDTIRPQFLADAPLTPPVLAQLLASTQGGRKAVGDRQFYAVLNQVDTPELRQQGIQIQQLLRQQGIPCVLTHFKEEEPA